MGAEACKEMGIFPCCMPSEDPGLEVRTDVPSYNGNAGLPNNSGPAPYAGGAQSGAFSPQQQGGSGADEFIMPPPPSGSGQYVVGNPSGGRAPGGGAGLTEDAILSDLSSAEMKAYQDVFASFANGGPVPLDNQNMRAFLNDNACIDDMEIALLQAMNDNMSVEMGSFLELLRNNSLTDGDCIGQFTQLSADGQQLASEECRTGLTMMGMDKFQANFSNDRWDAILNMVMMDAGPSVDMEQWMRYAKTVARFIRLFKYCGLN